MNIIDNEKKLKDKWLRQIAEEKLKLMSFEGHSEMDQEEFKKVLTETMEEIYLEGLSFLDEIEKLQELSPAEELTEIIGDLEENLKKNGRLFNETKIEADKIKVLQNSIGHVLNKLDHIKDKANLISDNRLQYFILEKQLQKTNARLIKSQQNLFDYDISIKKSVEELTTLEGDLKVQLNNHFSEMMETRKRDFSTLKNEMQQIVYDTKMSFKADSEKALDQVEKINQKTMNLLNIEAFKQVAFYGSSVLSVITFFLLLGVLLLGK